MTKINYAIAFILISVFFSCSKDKQFVVEGTISGAENQNLYFEKREHSSTAMLDSVKLDDKGNFKFTQKALGYPEFFRIKVGNEQVNFVIDSTETISINGTFKDLSKNYNITGNEASNLIKEANLNLEKLNSDINRFSDANKYETLSESDFSDSINLAFNEYKEKAKQIILGNYRNPSGYYVLFLRFRDQQILNPSDKNDLNLFRSVATIWDTNYPESPRTEFLKNYTLSAIAGQKELEQQLQNIEILSNIEPTTDEDFFTIQLPDINDNQRSTKDLKGKFVLLDFTVYDNPNSAQRNIILNQLYQKYKSKLDIYQVSFDGNNFKWKNVASNLPWITVRDNLSLQSPIIQKFNITSIPTSYILNKQGEIVRRIAPDDNIDKLIEEELKK